ncbi:MAG: hypothetical protein HKO57_11450, partial [Akkermansiaceae bacterium]|nr:hypothetical protein [Akkermansiaceae bacterium]
MKALHLATALLALACLPLPAQLVGTDDFSSYPDGNIDGSTGGTGFNYDNFDGVVTATQSDWNGLDFGGGAQQVVGGALATGGGGALREYNGPNEGAGGADGDDDGERSGAVRGTGIVFYKVDMTRSAGAEWGGMSSMDFGAERVFIGVPGNMQGMDVVGVEESGVGTTNDTTITLTDGSTYTLIGVVDFSNSLIGLFVDPDGDDFWNPSTGSNSADVTRGYGATNWSSGVRLASGGPAGSTTWDNLSVALDPVSVGLMDSSGDSDGDGINDDWEIFYFNDLTTANATSNNDFDGLTDLQEFNFGSDPTLEDADVDGLEDDEEQTAGTDPNDPDTDKDCFSDGDEVNFFLTNPLAKDTDGGGTNDATEIGVGTDPTAGNGGDDPATFGDLDIIGIDFFDSYGDGPLGGLGGPFNGEGWDYDNSKTNDAFSGHNSAHSTWDNVGGAPQVLGGVVVTQDSSINREFNGGQTADECGEQVGAFRNVSSLPSENANDVLYLKVELTRRAGAVWSGMSLYNFGAEEIFIGVPGAQNAGAYTFGIEESGTGNPPAFAFDGTTPIVPVDDSTNVLVACLDFANTTIRLFINPDLSQPEPAVPNAVLNPDPSNMNGTAVRLGSGGAGQSEWDGLVAATAWSALGVVATDSDGDGLPDDWEIFHFGNLTTANATSNNDSDTLTDLEEFEAGT